MAITRKFYKAIGTTSRKGVEAWLEKHKESDNKIYWGSNFVAGVTTCCSAVELSDLGSVNDAKLAVAEALVSNEKAVFYYCVDKKIEAALKEWGFKVVATWMGNHDKRVNVLFNNLKRRSK